MDKPDDTQTPKPGESQPTPYMPPKLRSKMRFDDEEPEEKGSNTSNIVALVMLVAIVVLGGFLYMSIQRSKAEAKVKAAAAAKAAAEQSRADSLEKRTQDSLFAARADSIAKVTPKKPAPTPPAAGAAAGGATAGGAAPATPPPPASKFGIDVGTFLNQDRANSEQTKLQGSTGLTAKVEPVTEDGVTSYRVVLGEFDSRAAAEKKANDLIVAQTVREAKVFKLKGH